MDSASPVVLYSLLGSSSLHAEQLLRSVESLRRWNRSIAVRVFLYGDVEMAIDQALQQFDVEVNRFPIKQRSAVPDHPTIHKWFSLESIGTNFRGDVLYLDCDTYLFGDVACIFENYCEQDWYAREEPFCRRSPFGYDPDYLDEVKWREISITYGGRYVPPFNTGVFLIKQGLRNTISQRLPLLLEFFARLESSLSGNKTIATTLPAIQFPSSNPWIIEQVALWLVLAGCDESSFGDFRRDHVIQSLEFLDIKPMQNMPVICHHFNRHTDEFLEWQRNNSALFEERPPTVFNATIHLPALDDEPSYLESGLWERGIGWRDVAKARDLNPTLRIFADTLQVTDSITGIASIFALRDELRMVLERLAMDPDVVESLPLNLRERLVAIGILEDPRVVAKRRCDWQATIADAHQYFRQHGYVRLPRLLSPIHLAWLRNRYRRLVREAVLAYGDRQCPTRSIAHNEPAARIIHPALSRTLSDVTGLELKPSYLYLACYEAGSELPEHTDREQCEFSVTMLVDYLPELNGRSPWPLYLRLADKTVSIRQHIGDALLYRGRLLPHFRKTLPKGHMSTSLFFHFVEENFVGSLN